MHAPHYEFRSVGNLGRLLVRMLIVDMVLTLLSIVSTGMEINLLSKLQEGEFVPPETLRANDLRQGLLGLLLLGYTIALFIVFAKWIYRVSANAHAVSPTDMTISPAWCIGWYFVPIANLYKPFEGMKEVWQVSTVQPGESPQDVRAPVVMRVWWGFWLLVGVVGSVSSFARMNAITVEAMLPADYLAVMEGAVSIMLSLSAMAVVRRLTNLQSDMDAAAYEAAEGTNCPECGEPADAIAVSCTMCGANLNPAISEFDA